MKEFEQILFDIKQAKQELNEFQQLLDNHSDLRERGDILPFFRTRKHLSALMGTYVYRLANPNLLALELQLFGEFSCDLAIGDSRTNTFCFVEFEDAKSTTLFTQKKDRNAPYWGNRLENAFGQVLDWLWILDNKKNTPEFRFLFGSDVIEFEVFVVLGRSRHISHIREKHRLQWRDRQLVVNSHKVRIRTFDELCEDLRITIQIYTGDNGSSLTVAPS